MAKKWVLSSVIFALLVLFSTSGAEQQRVARVRLEMTEVDLYRCGIGKLSDSEVANLELWFYERYSDPAWQPRRTGQLEIPQKSGPPAATGSATDVQVVFNTNSRVIHSPTCSSVGACTRNCISTTRSIAEARGGRPCARCRGGY